MISDAWTAYTLALAFALLPDARQRRHAGARVAALVRDNEYHISTGFVGTPLICDALCSVGEYNVAFRLLTERTCPSWLYPVTIEATTIWERWDSMLTDGSINPGEMTSFNLYAPSAYTAPPPYRVAGCSWEIGAGQITVNVVVPPNTTASVTLAGDQTQPIEVMAGTYQ